MCKAMSFCSCILLEIKISNVNLMYFLIIARNLTGFGKVKKKSGIHYNLYLMVGCYIFAFYSFNIIQSLITSASILFPMSW